MSHELRTPLNAILGFSEMVRDGHAGPPGPTWLDYADHVHCAGSLLLSVIKDVLDLFQESRRAASIFRSRSVELGEVFGACRELVARGREGRDRLSSSATRRHWRSRPIPVRLSRSC